MHQSQVQSLSLTSTRVASPLVWWQVRMPISDDLNPRNFVTKIVSYDKVSGPPYAPYITM